MMGGPLGTGVCVAMWVMVVARAGAQAGDNLQTPYRSPTSLTVLQNRAFEAQKEIGGRIEEGPRGSRWVVKGRSYAVDDQTERSPTLNSGNGHTGGFRIMHAGEATREWRYPPIGVLNGEQVSEANSDQTGDENPDSYLNGPGENKSSPVPDVYSADWSTDPGQWTYRDGEWVVVRLPNPAYHSLPPPPPANPSLPTPSPLAAALLVVANEKVEVERNVSGLANVTLHYCFYLRDNQHPDTPPELKVYHVVEGSRNLLQEEDEQGEWITRDIEVPQSDISSIVFEGWLKGDGNLIALTHVDTTGVTLGTEEALDVGDELTLTSGQPNTTESLTSTPTTEGNRTQDLPAPEEVSVMTDTEDQDNSTAASVSPEGTQVDPSLDSTVKTSQSPAEGEVEEGTITETPIDPSELEVSTDNPQNETQSSEQINGSTDVVALNSSMSSGDNVTSDDSESGYVSSTTTTDGEESETDEGPSTTTTVTDDETSIAENSPEAVLSTDENTDNSSILSIPGITTDSLQTNTSVILPDGNTTVTSDPSINTEISGNRNTSSLTPTRTRLTDEGSNISTNVLGGDELTTKTTLGIPQSNGTSGNITSPSGVTIPVERTIPESTPLPSLAANGTEAVTAVPVSSTSWQVFQVFLVLCVMGLLALGFLYWKKKRRQDDEIPVFTRHTDYHNPTFSMEDAANFMSRAGRNTYKTIE